MYLKQLPYFLCLVVGLSSCNEPVPRRPVKVKSGHFFKESAARSKKLLEQEEKQIQQIIAKDTLNTYHHTASGSWFYYDQKTEEEAYSPQTDDLVTMTYNILSLDNDTIYSQTDIGIITYKVDKQELFQGLRNSVKLLKEKETATFLFPSSLAYGYHGDNDKIGISEPLKSTISILKIEKQADKESEIQ